MSGEDIAIEGVVSPKTDSAQLNCRNTVRSCWATGDTMLRCGSRHSCKRLNLITTSSYIQKAECEIIYGCQTLGFTPDILVR